MNNPYFNNDGYYKPITYYRIPDEFNRECIDYIWTYFDKPYNVFKLDVCKKEYKSDEINQQQLKIYDENDSNIHKIGIVLEENCYKSVNSRKMMLLPVGKGIIPHYVSPSPNEIEGRILNCGKGFIKLD